jgi:hypothetical protein
MAVENGLKTIPAPIRCLQRCQKNRHTVVTPVLNLRLVKLMHPSTKLSILNTHNAIIRRQTPQINFKGIPRITGKCKKTVSAFPVLEVMTRGRVSSAIGKKTELQRSVSLPTNAETAALRLSTSKMTATVGCLMAEPEIGANLLDILGQLSHRQILMTNFLNILVQMSHRQVLMANIQASHVAGKPPMRQNRCIMKSRGSKGLSSELLQK